MNASRNGNSKRKLVFISNMASPHQVKFCYALQEYFDSEFWFYIHRENNRPKWWEVPLGDKCRIMKLSFKLPVIGYISFGLFRELIRFKPDIILLGGFFKWHWLVLSVVKLFSKRTKVAVLSEPSRYTRKESSKTEVLRTRENSLLQIKILRILFRRLDLYCGMGEKAAAQFIKEFGFPESKVVVLYYPHDIDDYFKHPLRKKEKGDRFRILFANRLIDRYNPLFVLEVFASISSCYPNIELLMNNDGPLREKCVEYIRMRNLENVSFIDTIDSWNHMNLIYKESDILILPATYSNGNGSIIEAIASGMGVVISNTINNIKDHCIDGKNCFICNLDIEEFAKAILKYIENPEILSSHGELGRNLVMNRGNHYVAKSYFEVLRAHDFVDLTY
jgi:glycosyltransferase involved in cell wall biosynthesis